MLTLRSLLCLSLVTMAPPVVLAQNSQCTQFNNQPGDPLNQGFNVCNAAIDATKAFHPVAGLLVSGGNPVLGTASTLGGFPHLSFTVRANATRVRLPELSYNGMGSTVPSGQNVVAPNPLIEAALGILKGWSRGFLSLDALGSAELIPTNAIDNLNVDPKARKIGKSIALGLGYGGRVGLLRGHGLAPSVSVSVMRRDLPRISYGDLNQGDQYFFSTDLHATNLRVVAGIKLVVLNLSAGVGYNKYTGTARMAFTHPVTSAQQTLPDLKLDNSRTMIFANGALDFPVLKIAAEVGYENGKDQKLPTTFKDYDTTKGRLFAGAGVRLAF